MQETVEQAPSGNKRQQQLEHESANSQKNIGKTLT
jgi:hypothetical protein